MKDRVVILQNEGTEDSSFGERKDIWVPKEETRRWAEIKPLHGQEDWLARQAIAEQVFRIQLPYVIGLNPGHRIREDGGENREFSIVAVKDPDGRKFFHVCECVQLVNVTTKVSLV